MGEGLGEEDWGETGGAVKLNKFIYEKKKESFIWGHVNYQVIETTWKPAKS